MRGGFVRVSAAIAMMMTPTLTGAGDAPRQAVSLTLHDRGHISVAVTVNGVGPFRFLVDTGSTASSIFEPLAKRLALSPLAQTTVITPVGRELRAVVTLGPIRVGRAELPLIEATVLTRGERRHLGLEVDGILGQDFLSKFHYTIDYRRRRLIWDDEGAGIDARSDSAPHASAQVRLLEMEGRSIVELPQGATSERPLRFVADSGASTVVVFAGTPGMSVPMIVDSNVSEAVSVLGTRKIPVMRLLELRIGDLALHNQPAVILARADGEHDVDGLLPLHLFSRVSFRHRDGTMVVSR